MSPILKQTIRNRSISFWKILAMIVITVTITNVAIDFFSRYGASFGSIAAIISLLSCTAICGRILYRKLAYYNYRIIEDELMVERVIGRSNHVFFHIKPKEIIYLKPYTEVTEDDKEIREYKFVVDNNKENWYVIKFKKEDKVCRLILEPNEAFLNALNRNLQKNQKDEELAR